MAAALGFMTGCTDKTDDALVDSSVKTFVLQPSGFTSVSTEGQMKDETTVKMLDAYIFTHGVLTRKVSDIPVSQGLFQMEIPETSGSLFLLANGTGVLPEGSATEHVTREEDFVSLYALSKDPGLLRPFMTAQLDLAQIGSKVTVPLKRGVARLDLILRADDIKVDSVVITQVARSGRIFPGSSVGTVNESERVEWVKRYRSPQTEDETGLCYLFEQTGERMQAKVYARMEGNAVVQVADFPSEIKRNTLYRIRVSGYGAMLSTVVEASEDWDEGETVDSEVIRQLRIDAEHTVLSDGARISAHRDTLYVPYTENTIDLAIAAEAVTEYTVRGQVDGVTLTKLPDARSGELSGNRFRIHSLLRKPGNLKEFLYLDLKNQDGQQTRWSRIVIEVEANRTEFKGFGTWDETYTCDFGTYVDGTLGTVKPPLGKQVRLEFEAGEDIWAKLEKDTTNDGGFRVVGGWKPNDPTANGRLQKVRLVIADERDEKVEIYTLVRRNWGLPVVNVNGTWWCKYNLRGNVKDFSDQILSTNDPAAGQDMAAYLDQSSDEMFLHYLGDQYQGGNPEGLKLAVSGGHFYYEGMKAQADNIALLPATAMAPDGYQIPSYDDYRFFTANENFNLGNGAGSFNNNLGQRLNYKIVERNATFLGTEYGLINYYDFEYNGAHLVLAGLGHQYGTTPGDLSKMVVLLGTHGKTGTWMLEGWEDRRGNWYKYAVHNNVKTRTLRCVKTPVEYIYE